MVRRQWILVAVAGVALWGCGALHNGPQQMVTIVTVPPGAVVTVNGDTVLQPGRVRLDRDREYEVTAAMDGFRTAHARILRERDPRVIAGNCVLFLCVPLLWEAHSPAAYRLAPATLELMLEPEGWSPR